MLLFPKAPGRSKYKSVLEKDNNLVLNLFSNEFCKIVSSHSSKYPDMDWGVAQ
jgi:hypothetical protein